jgi:serine/threonine-protein phosphatase 6 regulatory ankyrin repeat subunit B
MPTSTRFPQKLDAVPLYYAALFGLRDLAAHLLAEHPEGVDAKGGYEVTPFHASVMHGHFDVSSLLMEHLRNPDIRGRWLQTPLHRILMSDKGWRGDLEIGQRLLDGGADVNAQDNENWTPLFVAAGIGQSDFAQMLLEHGAAINARTDIGMTPLHRASERGHLDVVRLLLEHGADPSIPGDNGKTPSDVASKHEIVQLLSDYTAKPMRV